MIQLGTKHDISALQRYVARGHKRVDGWLNASAIDVIVRLAGIQRRLNVHGPVSEIGIHHGRLFILLHLLTDPPELSVAFDLFRRQAENVDGSGNGDVESFRKNLLKHGCDLTRIRIYAANSMQLSASNVIKESAGAIRLFSVDGGHTAGTTYHDLELAAGSLCEGGLVILDDFFNPDWPGVAEGTSRFLLQRTGALYPVVIIGNKFMFTNTPEWANQYSHDLVSYYRQRACFIKKTSAFGGEAITITPYGSPKGRLTDRVLDYCGNTRLWESIRYTTTGKVLKTGLRRIRDI
jgi:hypothetical protein